MRAKAPSNIKARLESLWGWLALFGFISIPVVLFIAVGIQSEIARLKQMRIDQAKASLSMGLSDLPTVGLDYFSPKPPVFPPGRQYGDFWICSYTNTVVAGGKSYPCVLVTALWDGQYKKEGALAITSNREFIWLDWRRIWLDYLRVPKVIAPDYKVSKWQRGY